MFWGDILGRRESHFIHSLPGKHDQDRADRINKETIIIGPIKFANWQDRPLPCSANSCTALIPLPLGPSGAEVEGNDRERVGGDEGEAPRQKSGVRLLNLNQVTAWRVLYNVQMYLVRTNADFAFNSLPEVHDSLQLLCVFFCFFFFSRGILLLKSLLEPAQSSCKNNKNNNVAEPRDRPCRPRARLRVRIKVRSGVGLVWTDLQY